MNSPSKWLTSSKHNKAKVAFLAGFLVLVAWLLFSSDVPDVKKFSASYTPQARYSAGFCVSLSYDNLSSENKKLKASINGVDAVLGEKITSGKDSGYYCYASKIQPAQKLHAKLLFDGDDVLNKTVPMPKPQIPAVYGIALQPDMSWKTIAVPAQAVVSGRYLNNFKLRISINGKWRKLGIMQKSMSTPDASGASGDITITQLLTGIHIPKGSNVYVKVQVQNKDKWKTIFERSIAPVKKKS